MLSIGEFIYYALLQFMLKKPPKILCEFCNIHFYTSGYFYYRKIWARGSPICMIFLPELEHVDI